jgi:hypothetical protein
MVSLSHVAYAKAEQVRIAMWKMDGRNGRVGESAACTSNLVGTSPFLLAHLFFSLTDGDVSRCDAAPIHVSDIQATCAPTFSTSFAHSMSTRSAPLPGTIRYLVSFAPPPAPRLLGNPGLANHPK